VEKRTVVVDTNILINLAHVQRLDLLGALSGYEFLAPSEVLEELTSFEARTRVRQALCLGHLGETLLEGLEALVLFADFRENMGRGESACLALAALRNWYVASDERRIFLREAQRLLGPGRILNTAGLFVLAIRRGLMTVDQADEAKQVLERCRFRMSFGSFRDLL